MMFTTKFYKKYYPVGKYTLMAPKDVRTMKKFLLEYPRELDISIHSIERRNYTWGLMYKKNNEDENVMLKLKSHMSENGFHEMSSDELELCNFILNWNRFEFITQRDYLVIQRYGSWADGRIHR